MEASDALPLPEERAEPGTLYLCATPIGNLTDMTLRAVALLRTVDRIACEDTRSSQPLLRRYGIERPLIAYHEHNEAAQAETLAEAIAAGESLALLSDAGTPAISDPGFRLVRACRQRGLPVVPLPGACAATCALSASGLPTDSFLFAGFLPPKSAARRRFLEEHREDAPTLVLYESTHRIAKLVGDIVEVLGPERCIAVCRELTKKFETFHVGPASEVAAALEKGSTKGEFVVCIARAGFQL